MFRVLILSFSLFALNLYAKSMRDFNEALYVEFEKEISKDEEKFKAKPSRAPASVEEESIKKDIKPPSKLDQNVKQLGPSEW